MFRSPTVFIYSLLPSFIYQSTSKIFKFAPVILKHMHDNHIQPHPTSSNHIQPHPTTPTHPTTSNLIQPHPTTSNHIQPPNHPTTSNLIQPHPTHPLMISKQCQSATLNSSILSLSSLLCLDLATRNLPYWLENLPKQHTNALSISYTRCGKIISWTPIYSTQPCICSLSLAFFLFSILFVVS